MKNAVLLLGLLILITQVAAASTGAPSARMNYQGKLTNATGAPVADGPHSITFKLFDVETGGESLWQTTASVQTMGGLFSTVLEPVPGDVFIGTLGAMRDLWLEITVEGIALFPRAKVVGVPYATVAGMAFDSQRLGGLDSSVFMRTDQSTGTVGSLSVGQLLSPSAGATGGISIAGSDTARIRLCDSDPGSVFSIEGGLNAADTVLVSAGGGITLSGGLNVIGGASTTLSGPATVGGNLRVNGDATLDRTLSVAGAVEVGPAGSLAVQGTTTTGALTVGSAASVNGALNVSSSASVGGTLGVGGATTLGSTLTTSGQITANNGLLVKGSDARFQVPAVMENVIHPQIGSTYGLAWPQAYGGDAGDAAWLRYYPSGRGATAMNLDLGLANDANDQLNLISPGGVYVQGDLNVSGALNATLNPGTFDARYLLKSGDDQTFTGDIINTQGENCRNPLASTMGSISSQMFSGRYYYGPNSTSTITIGQGNPVSIPGALTVGNLSTSGALSAGLLYDTGNTSYYADPAGTSRLYNIRVGSTSGVSEDVQTGLMWFDGTQYGIFRESGPWASPYPGLRIAFHTGVKIGASSTYGGTRFFSSSDMANEILSVGSGDNNVRVNYDLYSPVLHDKDDPGYYVDPAGTSNVNNLTVNGTINAPAGKPKPPIAYAYINSDGTKASGTSNLTSVWNSGLGLERYEITLAGEYYFLSSYVTTVTPSASSSVRIPTTTASSGKLFVQMYDLSGNKVQSAFQVVIYKP